MTTNAPYYQIRSGQFTNSTNGSFAHDHALVGNGDLAATSAASAARPPNDTAITTHHLYSKHAHESNKGIPVIASLEVENHNFVELLEAASEAAAGQADMVENTLALADPGVNMRKGKRKRASSSPPLEGGPGDMVSGPKRPRVDCPTDPQLNNDQRDRSESGSVPPSSESLLHDARAAGVHSAAALFRRSSEKTSRKYTRPPMSKLFISLQLTPENFLHLQAQAKTYMLDPAHPERQNCVGNRGRGDTDMVKLRLFNCVRDFLDDGVGEQYFGEGVEKPGETDTLEAARVLGQGNVSNEDKLIWPRDGNKIISLVTPLLRRMVTNERQRMYAIETRKGGSKKKEATPTIDDIRGLNDVNGSGQHPEQLQTAFEPPRPHPLAPAQSQVQRLYTLSPSSPLPPNPQSTDRDSEMTIHYAESKSVIELFPGEKLMLPTEQAVKPFLSKINIFVTKNGHVLRSEKRFTNLPSAPLFHMTWQELTARVLELVQETLSLYPQLEENLGRSTDIGPEALRGLAVAAMHNQTGQTTEIGTDVEASETPLRASSFAPSPPKQGLISPLSGFTSAVLPDFRIGTQTSKGWVNITGEEEWSVAKKDLAGAVWADKVCSVVVTLLS
ncbi:hypothetical protein CC80DRAFT_21328 [Byssothecium circinans]|uniref:Uncharacterized protein n=1 Tax=Byssothecium circinans TaxID=147558 RepID=A0A6A5U1N6_9PLEO|nr:hypothetical protein CC80DRAFT_21328 [Byssothecium circinans]